MEAVGSQSQVATDSGVEGFVRGFRALFLDLGIGYMSMFSL